MKLTINLLLVVCGLSFSTQKIVAQEPAKSEPAKGTLSEEIEVVRPYKPVLANAAKIRRNPDLTDLKPFKPTLTYAIADKKLALNSDIKQLQYQALTPEKAPEISNNYLKLGAGTLKTGMAELYLNTNRDEALQAGFFLSHLSQQDKLPKQQFSSQQFSVFGKTISNKQTLSGSASFHRLGTYFYGSDPIALININPAKQTLQAIQLEGTLANKFVEGDGKWNYRVGFETILFSTATQQKENTFVVNAAASKTVKQFSFGMQSKLDLSAIKQTGNTLSNNLVKANPFAQYQKDDFKLRVGLNIVQEFGTHSKLSTLPAIDLSAPVAGKDLFFIAGLKGDVAKTSIFESSFINPYVGSMATIENSVTQSNLFAGFSGNLGPNVGFKATGFFKRVNKLPLFINNSTNLSAFDIIYDPGTSNLSGFNLNVSIKASDVFRLESTLESTKYELSTEEKAWFKPAITVNTELQAKLNSKLDLSASLQYNGNSYGKLSNAPAQNQIVTIKSYLTIGLGARYVLTKKWGAFIQANNLLNSTYQQYLYYNGFGRQIFGGISYSF